MLPLSGSACPRCHLSDLTIHNICHHLTRARIGDARPSCEAAWRQRLDDDDIPFDIIWPSVGTELTTSEDEAVWFRFLHRGIFVHNRNREGDSIMCRLGCGHEENQLHILRCPKILPAWKHLFSLLRDVGMSKPRDTERAIIFGLQSNRALMNEGARALLRHAMREVWNAFSAVDLRDRPWRSKGVVLASLEALQRALIRRAARVSLLHANRQYTEEPDQISTADAAKFPEFITMSPTGEYALAPALTSAIADLRASIAADAAAAAAHYRPRKRPRSAPPGGGSTHRDGAR